MKKNFKFILLFLSVFLCFSAVVYGQRTTGTIEGTVKDPQGAVVPGISVTVTGVTVGFNQTVESNNNGVYRLQQIPVGVYKITTAAAKGFGAVIVDNVTVTIEQTTLANISLGVTTSVNTVEVSSDPLGVNLDTTESKVQTNITSQLIEQLPKGTSFQSLLGVAPGVRAESKSGGIQIDGASGSENTFLVDGQALESFRTGALNGVNNIPTNLIQEVQIKTGGFEAEHGGASGGVISVATKSGSNSLHGEFGAQFDTAKLQPRPRFGPSTFQNGAASQIYVYGIRPPRSEYTNYFPTASLGGAIIKDKVWFYGNYSPQILPLRRNVDFYDTINAAAFASSTINNAPLGVTTPGISLTKSKNYPSEVYQKQDRYEYAFGRIDAAIFNNLRYSGTFLWNPLISDGKMPYNTISVGGTPNNARLYNGKTYTDREFQSLGGGRTNSNNWTNQLVYTATSNLIFTGRYNRAFQNEKNGNYAVPVGTRYICTGLTAGYTGVEGCPRLYDTGSNAAVIRDVSIKDEINTDATYVVDALGTHTFKGGYQYGTIKNDVNGSTVNNPVDGAINLYYGLNFSNVGLSSLNCDLKTATNPGGTCLGYGRLYRYGTSGIASNKYQAIFVQDSWRPSSRLTLNLGVRLEKENLPAFNAGSGKPGIALNLGWSKKIAPRLGGAFDLFGDGKTKIWASYSWFYDRLKFELPRGSFGGDFYRVDYFPISVNNPSYNYYTVANVLGNFKDPIGGGDPSAVGGLSKIQLDYRIPSNISEAEAKALGLPFAGLDPDLKPFKQEEITVGVERELSRLYIFSVRFTRKNISSATEDVGILGDNGSENYIIANPGEGLALKLGKQTGYAKFATAQREYKGVEFSITKRFSNNYNFSANYTLSKLFGNYSGLASSDENGRTSPGVTRYFDYIVNGFTYNGEPDNGDLATDRRHAFKAYGGYRYDWFGSKTNSTDISFFQTILQGTPQTTYMGIYQSSIVFTKRGDLGRTPMFSQTDISLGHKYKFGNDGRFTAAFDVNVLNVFNQNTVTSFNTTKYQTANTVGFDIIDPNYGTTHNPVVALNAILTGKYTAAMADTYLKAYPGGNQLNPLYGKGTGFQSDRTVRFGFRLLF